MTVRFLSSGDGKDDDEDEHDDEGAVIQRMPQSNVMVAVGRQIQDDQLRLQKAAGHCTTLHSLLFVFNRFATLGSGPKSF